MISIGDLSKINGRESAYIWAPESATFQAKEWKFLNAPGPPVCTCEACSMQASFGSMPKPCASEDCRLSVKLVANSIARPQQADHLLWR